MGPCSESATDVFVAVCGGSHETVLWCDRAKRGFACPHEPYVTPSVHAKAYTLYGTRPVLPSIRATLGTLVPRSPMVGVDWPHKAVGMCLRPYEGEYRRADRDLLALYQRITRMSRRGLVTTCLCHTDVGWFVLNCDLCLARLLGRDLVGRFASLGCSTETWLGAPPCLVDRWRLSRVPHLAGLLGGGLVSRWAVLEALGLLLGQLVSGYPTISY